MRKPHNRYSLHCRMTQQPSFNFYRRDFFAATNDHVLQTIANFDVTVVMNDGRIAGMKPAIAHRLGRGFRIVVIAVHYYIAAHHDLAHGDAVASDWRAGFVDNGGPARNNQPDTLTCFYHPPFKN